MSAVFLLVLEGAEASGLAPGWPVELLLVARIDDGDDILSVEPLAEPDLRIRLRGPGAPPVHPPRQGSASVELSFGREAAVIAAAGSAARLLLVRHPDPELVPSLAPSEYPRVDAQSARAAGMVRAKLWRLEAGLNGGPILGLSQDRPQWPRILWGLRDIVWAAALLGAFAVGLLISGFIPSELLP